MRTRIFMDVRVRGERERRTGERRTASGERGAASGERGASSGERRTASVERGAAGFRFAGPERLGGMQSGPLALGIIALSLPIGVAMSGEPALGPLNIDTPALAAAEAKALHNPVPNTSKSIRRGRLLFATSGCVSCHGSDGKALIEVVANATDLTNPKVWKNGTEEGQIFRSIRDGAGVAMPAFKGQIAQEEDIWNLVNFIHSLWPQEQRPPVVAE